MIYRYNTKHYINTQDWFRNKNLFSYLTLFIQDYIIQKLAFKQARYF